MHEPNIHPSAIIDHPVSIGHRTRIWHFCHVCTGAIIGQDCVIGQNGYVASTAVVGDRCRIQNNVSLYDGVILEADVFVGPSAVFTNVVNPRAMISRRAEFRTTHVGRGATIGANATILPGVTLGAFCFVGAGAVVVRDVLPHALVLGVPAEPKGWVSRAANRLDFEPGTGEATCPSTGERYKLTETGPQLCSKA
jgi:UDP-2-acetamido-3-amino-2,3-dideoxy-glucuronate N-acetyltransferase